VSEQRADPGAERVGERVQLLGVPVAVVRRAVAYQEELERECALVVLRAGSAPGVGVARSLLRVTSALRQGGEVLAPEAVIDAAEARGDVRVDIELRVPRSMIGDVAELQRTLDAADELCGEGHMLTIAPAPEISAFRRWYLDEVVRQLGDASPTPWSEV
jgi:hypothetical protein